MERIVPWPLNEGLKTHISPRRMSTCALVLSLGSHAGISILLLMLTPQVEYSVILPPPQVTSGSTFPGWRMGMSQVGHRQDLTPFEGCHIE